MHHILEKVHLKEFPTLLTKSYRIFSYEIKGDEKYIPVRTFNLNNPLGYKSVFWESNVNPQQDATSDINISGVEDGNGNLYKYRVRDIATETELLKFRYVDNSKKR